MTPQDQLEQVKSALRDALNTGEGFDELLEHAAAAAIKAMEQCQKPKCSDDEIIRRLTFAMREADAGFLESGGSTRHYIRDWFLPHSRRNGVDFVVTDSGQSTLEPREGE